MTKTGSKSKKIEWKELYFYCNFDFDNGVTMGYDSAKVKLPYLQIKDLIYSEYFKISLDKIGVTWTWSSKSFER